MPRTHFQTELARFAKRVARRILLSMLASAVGMVAVGQLQAQEQMVRLPPPELSGPEAAAPLLGETYIDDGGGRSAFSSDGALRFRPPMGLDGPEMLPPPLRTDPGSRATTGEDLQFPTGPLYLDEGLDQGFDEATLGFQKLTTHKDGFFQKLCFSAAQVGTGGDRTIGITEIESALTVAVPAPIREWPMLITPGYNVRFVDGPHGLPASDLPPALQEAYLDFTWLPTFVHRYTMMLSVAPSYYNDYQSTNDAFRLTGKALLIYDWQPERLQFIAGVLYLNRDNVRLLPAGGVIWTPNDWARFELLFPKPRIGLRFNVGEGFEDWVYTAAEFGGNTWAVERDSGVDDTVTFLDYRILLGVERKRNGGAGVRLEVGYVFGRSVKYASGNGDFDPSDSFIVRGGSTF